MTMTWIQGTMHSVQTMLMKTWRQEATHTSHFFTVASQNLKKGSAIKAYGQHSKCIIWHLRAGWSVYSVCCRHRACRTLQVPLSGVLLTQDSKQATRKRIESLKKEHPGSPGRKPRAGPFKQSNAAAEAEARGPKKLSQIKVDPSIAKSLGVPSRGSSPAPSAASAAASKSQNPSDMLDLFGDSTGDAAAPPAQPAQVGLQCKERPRRHTALR